MAALTRGLDAEAAELEVANYKALRESLRRQVEDEVPREGRRVYLRARLDDLRGQIGAEVKDLERLEAELRKLENRQSEPLDARLRAVLEDSIRPRYVLRERNERAGFVIVAVVLILALSPIDLVRIVSSGFETITYSAHASPRSVAVAMIIGALAVCLVVSEAARRFLPRRLRSVRPWPRLWLATFALAIMSAGFVVFGGVESDQSTALFTRAYYTQDDSETATSLIGRADAADTMAAVLLWLGVASLGASGASMLVCVRLQQRS